MIALACLAELAHLCVVSFSHPALLTSNLVQFFIPLYACGIMLYQRSFLTDNVSRRCWGALAGAFGIWASAQAIYIFSLFRHVPTVAGLSADNALWLIFGLPILLAINTTYEEWDKIQWLDRAQEIAFFLVLYVLVFERSDRLSQNTAFLIQNFALLLCCVLRLPACTAARERRFFIRLTAFLVLYGVLETIGDVLYLHGWQPGTPVDLIWSLPFTCFVVMTLYDIRHHHDADMGTNRLIRVFQRAKGVSVATLAFLSIGASAYLANEHVLLGGLALTFCFVLFGLRTNARASAHGRKRMENWNKRCCRTRLPGWATASICVPA